MSSATMEEIFLRRLWIPCLCTQISIPGFDSGSQCSLETVKSDLLFEELLFCTKQNRRVDRIG